MPILIFKNQELDLLHQLLRGYTADQLKGSEMLIELQKSPAEAINAVKAPAEFLERARAHYAGSETIGIDDDAIWSPTGPSEVGDWVQAWVWVPRANPEGS